MQIQRPGEARDRPESRREIDDYGDRWTHLASADTATVLFSLTVLHHPTLQHVMDSAVCVTATVLCTLTVLNHTTQ